MKLHGFYRITKTYPAPVIPLFTDGFGKFYVQNIDKEKRISEFSSFEPESNRIIIDTSSSYLEKNVGTTAIYAIEYMEKSVRFGDINQISIHIRNLETQNYFKRHPFALLELALLADISDLIEKAVRECSRALQVIDPKLARSWILGSDVDPKLKSNYFDDTKDENQIEEVHLSFSSSYYSLINLTEFSRNNLKNYRHTIFKFAINEIILNGTKFMEKNAVDSFLQIFLNSINNSSNEYNNTGRDIRERITKLVSRGNIKLNIKDYNLFLSKILPINMEDYINIELNDEQRQVIYHFFFENRSRFFIFAMYIYYYVKFPEFANFIEKCRFLSIPIGSSPFQKRGFNF